MNSTSNKILNFLFATAIILIIATVIRSLAYYIIGIPNERVFTNGVFFIWGISVAIIIFRTILKRSQQ